MKLQKYKEQEAANYANAELQDEYTSKVGNFYGFYSSFEEGFDKALELDLPIKFAIWLAKEGYCSSYRLMNNIEYVMWHKHEDVSKSENAGTHAFHSSPIKINYKGTQELYSYWLENIFKLN